MLLLIGCIFALVCIAFMECDLKFGKMWMGYGVGITLSASLLSTLLFFTSIL